MGVWSFVRWHRVSGLPKCKDLKQRWKALTRKCLSRWKRRWRSKLIYLVLLICNKRVAFSLSFIVKVSLLFVICYVYVWNLHVLEKHQKKTIWTRLSHWKHKLSVWIQSNKIINQTNSKHHHPRWPIYDLNFEFSKSSDHLTNSVFQSKKKL